MFYCKTYERQNNYILYNGIGRRYKKCFIRHKLLSAAFKHCRKLDKYLVNPGKLVHEWDLYNVYCDKCEQQIQDTWKDKPHQGSNKYGHEPHICVKSV